jgi:hypothetical protein
LKDYTLRNISLDIDIYNKYTGISSDNFLFNNHSGVDVPALSSYPLPIFVNYTGPIENKNYVISINYSYYDEINNVNKSDTIYGEILIRSNLISENKPDLIPYMFNFSSPLYTIQPTNITIFYDNFGNDVVNDNFRVSLYYRNVSEDSFTLYDTTVVDKSSRNHTFNFLSPTFGNIILKAVIDEDNDVNETIIADTISENNNMLSILGLVRDLEVEIVDFVPLYDNATNNGIIPIKIFFRNNGIGGIDEIDLVLNLKGDKLNYTFSKTFFNIPNAGREFIYNWNASSVKSGLYLLESEAIPYYDIKLSNNIKYESVYICPLPWFDAPYSCFEQCQTNCLDLENNRYKGSCDGISGCSFYNSTFAKSCDGLLKDSYTFFNITHDASCPSADVKKLKVFSDQKINITYVEDCENVIIDQNLVIYQSKVVIMNIVQCVMY